MSFFSGACADAGYELAATQYSTECRCGHVLDVPSLVRLALEEYLIHRLMHSISFQVILSDQSW